MGDGQGDGGEQARGRRLRAWSAIEDLSLKLRERPFKDDHGSDVT